VHNLQRSEKLIVLIESNERAFDAATAGGGLKIRGHALCVVLEFKIFLLFV
jgi:hypothetical protein